MDDPKFETWPEKQARLAREASERAQAEAEQETASEPNPPTNDLSISELAHVRHVLQKHFFHDVPDAADIPAGSAGFCPLCPAPVTVTHNDGSAVCANGHRFPQNSVKRK